MLQCRAIELWRPVVGFEDAYEVSNCGGVRSLDRVRRVAGGHERRVYGQPLKLYPRSQGHYLEVGLGRGTRRYVHILVLEAFVGLRPPGLMGLHEDDDKLNNRVGNLRWGDRSDNQLDMVRNGRHHWANKVFCPRGHELAHPNLCSAVLPRRSCKACARASAALRYRFGPGFDRELLQAAGDDHYARIMACG